MWVWQLDVGVILYHLPDIAAPTRHRGVEDSVGDRLGGPINGSRLAVDDARFSFGAGTLTFGSDP